MAQFSHSTAKCNGGSVQAGRPSAFSSVSLDSFRSAVPELRITKRRLRQLEAIQLVRQQRDTRTQDVSYNARPFVLCGLPLRRPPANQLVFTRRNGSFVLEITAHPRFGLPYGQDRLIPIWIATLTLKQKTRIVHFEGPTQLLDYFHLPKDGAQYRRVKAAFQRVFAATIFFGTEQDTKKQIVIDSARFHFMDSMRLWFNCSGEPQSAGNDESDNTITLSEAFYQEIAAHPIPVEREVIAALAHAPGLLDFYLWIAWEELDGQRPARSSSDLWRKRPQPPVGHGPIHNRQTIPTQDRALVQTREASLARMPGPGIIGWPLRGRSTTISDDGWQPILPTGTFNIWTLPARTTALFRWAERGSPTTNLQPTDLLAA